MDIEARLKGQNGGKSSTAAKRPVRSFGVRDKLSEADATAVVNPTYVLLSSESPHDEFADG